MKSQYRNGGYYMSKFDGKVVLITGGSRDMGVSHARAFFI